MKIDELIAIDGVTTEMVNMIVKASEDHLMIYSPYQGLWFFPDQLVKMWKEKRFRWKPQNWELRKPEDAIRHLNQRITNLHESINEITIQRSMIAEYMNKK